MHSQSITRAASYSTLSGGQRGSATSGGDKPVSHTLDVVRKIVMKDNKLTQQGARLVAQSLFYVDSEHAKEAKFIFDAVAKQQKLTTKEFIESIWSLIFSGEIKWADFVGPPAAILSKHNNSDGGALGEFEIRVFFLKLVHDLLKKTVGKYDRPAKGWQIPVLEFFRFAKDQILADRAELIGRLKGAVDNDADFGFLVNTLARLNNEALKRFNINKQPKTDDWSRLKKVLTECRDNKINNALLTLHRLAKCEMSLLNWREFEVLHAGDCVKFNCFEKNDNKIMTAEMVDGFLSRNAAIVTADSFQAIDLILPVSKTSTGSLGRQIVIQVKNRKEFLSPPQLRDFLTKTNNLLNSKQASSFPREPLAVAIDIGPECPRLEPNYRSVAMLRMGGLDFKFVLIIDSPQSINTVPKDKSLAEIFDQYRKEDR